MKLSFTMAIIISSGQINKLCGLLAFFNQFSYLTNTAVVIVGEMGLFQVLKTKNLKKEIKKIKDTKRLRTQRKRKKKQKYLIRNQTKSEAIGDFDLKVNDGSEFWKAVQAGVICCNNQLGDIGAVCVNNWPLEDVTNKRGST